MNQVPVTELTLAEMADVFNLADPDAKMVKKFSSRAEGKRRTAARLQECGMIAVREEDGTVCVAKAPTSPGLARMQKQAGAAGTEAVRQTTVAEQERAKAEVAAKRPAVEAGAEADQARDRAPPAKADDVPSPAPAKRGASAAYADDAAIKVLAAENPKRAGTATHGRFGLYAKAKTVGGYCAAVGDRRVALADIAWDTGHGYVKIG
jgi:hypothetical protein